MTLDRVFRAAGIAVMALMTPVQSVPGQTLEEKLAVCFQCHGAKSLPTFPKAPIIWGQHAEYLYLQLRDFKYGSRQHEFMNIFAATLQKEELLSFARHIADQPWPKSEFRATLADDGGARRAAAAGKCAECHLQTYAGMGVTPRLAGQTAFYLEKTMLDFKTGARANSHTKPELMAAISDDEIRALASYLAGL